MRIKMELQARSYEILVERGALHRAGQELNLNRRVLVVTDDGVPARYAEELAAQAREAHMVTLPQGEATKCLDRYQDLLAVLVEHRFTRTDCVVAVGGGVVGDLAGFAAATYLRGIDFYNVPTTVLSQVDSSIGGKVAIDFGGCKNLVGAFWQPRKVLIDPEVLETLPRRQVANGLAESVKMALTSDADLFRLFEEQDPLENLEEILIRSLQIKRSVVEQDERETGLRKILNFGHTLGHGIESASHGRLYHGECVALGMVPMCSEAVRARLLPVLRKLQLPTRADCLRSEALAAAAHDKKSSGSTVTVIQVPEIGTYTMEQLALSDLDALLRQVEGLQ